MSLTSEIIIVSGLPRSGTSLMMQMLHQGGIPVVTDEIRTADTDNPRGYYEFERVKKTKEDSSWLPDARGKVVKMVSSLLYDLPATEAYRIVFMRRDIDEMLESQEKMLARLSRSAATCSARAGNVGEHGASRHHGQRWSSRASWSSQALRSRDAVTVFTVDSVLAR